MKKDAWWEDLSLEELREEFAALEEIEIENQKACAEFGVQITEKSTDGIWTLGNLLHDASEELKAAKEDAARWEALANEWMADYDKLKNKYEPMIAVTSAALRPVAEEEGGERG